MVTPTSQIGSQSLREENFPAERSFTGHLRGGSWVQVQVNTTAPALKPQSTLDIQESVSVGTRGRRWGVRQHSLLGLSLLSLCPLLGLEADTIAPAHLSHARTRARVRVRVYVCVLGLAVKDLV